MKKWGMIEVKRHVVGNGEGRSTILASMPSLRTGSLGQDDVVSMGHIDF